MANAFLKLGCCGFPLVKTEYAKRFSVVEVQQTFYDPPKRLATLRRWREMAPDDFEFTLKAWQLITHTAQSPTFRRLKTSFTQDELNQCGSFRWTDTVRRAWEISRTCADALGAKNLLFQCPASFTPTPQNIEQMRAFFSSIERYDLNLFWEPRGVNWSAELIQKICRELKLIHAVDPFVSQSVTPEFIYFRLHGGKGFKHVYSDDELASLIKMVPPNVPAYILFNNIAMLNDAERFKNWI